jgi:hypothetical protein
LHHFSSKEVGIAQGERNKERRAQRSESGESKTCVISKESINQPSTLTRTRMSQESQVVEIIVDDTPEAAFSTHSITPLPPPPALPW